MTVGIVAASGALGTRLYLPSSGTAPASPAYGSLWDTTASASRLPLVKTKSNTAFLRPLISEAVATAPYDVLARQWVSGVLPAGSISGNLAAVLRSSESTTTSDMMMQLRVAVFSGNGVTLRGELYAGQAATSVSATVSDNNAELGQSDQTRMLQVALSPVTATAGDRIVIEIGYRSTNTSTSSRSGAVEFGDVSATADHALSAGVATQLVPWVEFDSDLGLVA